MRNALGPAVDAWAERIGEGIAEADSLAAAGEWIESRGAETLDVSGAEEQLGRALLASHLAGRYDIEADSVDVARVTEIALASAAARHTRLGFDEQIDFFRSKLNLPTEPWTGILHEQHDRNRAS